MHPDFRRCHVARVTDFTTTLPQNSKFGLRSDLDRVRSFSLGNLPFDGVSSVVAHVVAVPHAGSTVLTRGLGKLSEENVREMWISGPPVRQGAELGQKSGGREFFFIKFHTTLSFGVLGRNALLLGSYLRKRLVRCCMR